MGIIKFLFSKSKLTLFLATFFGLLGGASSTFLITTIHRGLEAGLPPGNLLTIQFYLASAVYLVTYLCGQVPLFLLSEGAAYHLRLDLIERILATPLRHLEELGSHLLYATLTDDINNIARGLNVVPKLVIYVMIVLGCLGYVSILSWQVMAMLAALTAITLMVFRLITVRARRRFYQSRDTGDTLFKHFRDVTEGLKELKLNAGRRRDFLQSHLRPTAARYKSDRVWGLSGFELATTLGNLGFFFLIGAVVFIFPAFYTLEAGMVGGVVLVLVFMIGPLSALLNLMPILSQAGVALRKVASLGLDMDRKHGDEREQAPAAAPVQWSRLVLEGLVHTYYNERKDEAFCLGPLDLTIARGEVLFITGGNGSGKSTLGKLVAGLYVPESGTIRLGDLTISGENRELLRQCFATVFNDYHLFDTLLGLEWQEVRERMQAYLAKLHLEHKVKTEKSGFSTTALSTGQRKRLALLVAVAEDRPIMLFDEWAGDQDPEFKGVFYRELIPELKAMGKTVIAITHDDQYFDAADRIVKLSEGKLLPLASHSN